MTTPRHRIRSPYMEWAKLHSHARFNLANSGVASVPLAKLRARLEELELSAAGAYGYEPLQERLARKCNVTPECVVAATGTSLANHLALAALVDPGDEILVEHPTYELLLTTAQFLGARIRRFPRRFENNFIIDPRDIERALTPQTRLIVLTNLHNPSAARTEESVLREIGELALRAGARVLVDEVYLEAVFGPPVRSAFHFGPHFVATSSLTKAYGLNGLRCGWILAAPELAERMWRLNDLFGVIPAHIAELLSVMALDHLDEIARDACTLLAANRAILNRFFDSRSDLRAVRPEFGTVDFPRVLRGSADRLCDLLREKYESAVVPGRFFEMPEHFRIGIGGDTATLTEGLRRLGAALDELARAGAAYT